MTLLDAVKKEAIKMAKEIGVVNMTRDSLGERVGIPRGSFQNAVGMTYADFMESISSDLPITKHKLTKNYYQAMDRLEHKL